MKSIIYALAVMAMITLPGAATADSSKPQHYKTSGQFEDVWQDLQDAIINRGLKVDYVGHIGKMLERTSAAAGSVTASGSQSPYLNAKYLQFCSAKLTHQSVSANPFNLSICPYVVFAFEAKTKPGEIVVGYRRPVPGPSKRTRAAIANINKLLDEIVKEAAAQ